MFGVPVILEGYGKPAGVPGAVRTDLRLVRLNLNCLSLLLLQVTYDFMTLLASSGYVCFGLLNRHLQQVKHPFDEKLCNRHTAVVLLLLPYWGQSLDPPG